jgi:Tol biopolymer transport system component
MEGIRGWRSSSKVVLVLTLLIAVGMAGRSEGELDPEAHVRVGLVRDIYPGWSPDGQYLAFHSTRVGPVAQIFKMEIATGEVTQLTSGPGEKRVARFSPDGRRIAFHREEDEAHHGDLFVMNADGSGLENLTNDQAGYWHPSWISNDQILVDSDRDDSGEAEIGNKELYILSLSSGSIERLTHFDDWDTFASLSPDGKRITWRRVIRNEDGSRNAEVFVMDRDGSNKINLSRHAAFDAYPTWSPDGERILFASNRDEENYEEFNLYLIDPDGSDLVKITETIPHVEQIRPMYAPDGESIIYNRQYLDGRIEIYRLAVSRDR